MKQLYQISGQLNKGFVGQISYTVCLEQTYKELLIQFSFNKQHFEAVTEKLGEELGNQIAGDYGLHPSKDELEHMILYDTKTEIHTLVTLDDTFIGCIHRQLTTRQMYFSKEEATEGCIPQPSISGVLKVTLLVFQVIEDGTDYNLQVLAC